MAPAQSPSTADVTGYRSTRGVLLMLGAVASFTAMVTAVKILRESQMSTPAVMFWRMAPGIPIIWLTLRASRTPLRPRRVPALAARCVFGLAAMATYFWAVKDLTLFQNTALALTQPVFVALVAPVVLRERLRGLAWLALLLAFAGAAVMLVPPKVAGPLVTAASIPLLAGIARMVSSLSSAVAHIMIRRATATTPETPNPKAPKPAPPDPPELVVFYFSIFVTVASLIAAWATTGAQSLVPAQEPTLIALLAGFGLVGQVLLSRAYSRTSAPVVAIVGYSAIPMSLFADAMVWDASVSISGWVGTVLVVVAGLTLVRNRPTS